ncbi:VPLPA-CTERM sorting domain-containing protein [Ruegeria arenilitoris]|uniref:VPLPA-CTERM sorting domain-containing protein n=1 Tax=Ruegeria arenilitoris TaxID=1173585 RepID=UPI001479ADED|nr:VPLPA-CTERM sorting domain-containing protein [Ruegeria arenilitoris]
MRKIQVAVLCAFCAFTVPASAKTLNYEIVATVGSVHSDLTGAFTVGSQVTGSFSVETVPYATHPISAGGEVSGYNVSNFLINFASYSLGADTTFISVIDNDDYGNPAVDVYDRVGLYSNASQYTTSSPVNGFAVGNFGLFGETRGAPPIDTISGTDVEAALGAFSQFAFRFMNLQFDGFRNVQMSNINIRQVTPSPVPLPASLPLFLIGLTGLGLVARRRRSQ